MIDVRNFGFSVPQERTVWRPHFGIWIATALLWGSIILMVKVASGMF